MRMCGVKFGKHQGPLGRQSLPRNTGFSGTGIQEVRLIKQYR